MSEAVRTLFLETADEEGWLAERDKKIVTQELREVARGLKENNVPLTVIVNTTKLTLKEVEAL